MVKAGTSPAATAIRGKLVAATLAVAASLLHFPFSILYST